MNCLILEDEPLAADVLKDYIQNIPELKLKAVSNDGFDALNVLRNEQIELLFVDINLPKLSGLDFLKVAKGNYFVIITTAYHEFALEGFNLNVVDYLLKPIEFSRFLKAISKVFELQKRSNVSEREFLFFNVDKKQVKVFLDEIDYIESLKDYVKIHLNGKHIVTKFQIGELERILENKMFLRVHKSFIINKNKLAVISATEVEVGKKNIPIGRTYKEELDRQFGKYIKTNKP